MRILVVDDDPISRELLENVLCCAGFEVEQAENGSVALDRLRAGAARLVVSDWDMPQLNGLDLCRAIRGGDFVGYVYVILLTAHRGSGELVAGLAAGADDFVVKPFNAAELVMRVRAGERVLSIETRDVAMFAMAKLAESRDFETGQHLERVRCYSRLLAVEAARMPRFAAEIDPEFIRLIYQTSPLHDIGKVGIPDSILLKAGSLNDAEYSVMKQHTTIGAGTLEAALERYPEARFLRIARDIALTHHERYNGTGYPRALRGDEIPLCGRIVALADVYDALTSKRVYKAAYDHEMARSIIVNERGAHFDPDLVDAFLAVEQQFIEIREQFGEAVAVGAPA